MCLISIPKTDGAGQPFDSAASVYFEDRAAHDAALGSPQGLAALADLPRYLDTNATRCPHGLRGA